MKSLLAHSDLVATHAILCVFLWLLGTIWVLASFARYAFSPIGSIPFPCIVRFVLKWTTILVFISIPFVPLLGRRDASGLPIAVAIVSFGYVAAIRWCSLRARKHRAFRNERARQKETAARAADHAAEASAENDRRRFNQQQRIEDLRLKNQQRLECEVFRDEHAQHLDKLFPRTLLHEYFERYMSNDHPLTDVRAAAGRLLKLMSSYINNKPEPQRQHNSPEQITSFYKDQRLEVEKSALTDAEREALISDLNFAEDQAIELWRKQ